MQNKNGFSLIELLIVIGIIGVLTSIMLPQYQIYVLKTQRLEAIFTADQISTAQVAYKGANDQYFTQGNPGGDVHSFSEVMRELGIEMQWYGPGNQTKSGYSIWVKPGCMEAGCSYPNQVNESFIIRGFKDVFDDVPYIDEIYIRSNLGLHPYESTGFKGPDLVPQIYYDEINGGGYTWL